MWHRLVIPIVLPLASRWVALQEEEILHHGQHLNATQQEDAEQVGIQWVSRVRIRVIDPVPIPVPQALQRFLSHFGWVPGDIGGMTLRYGINLHPHCARSRGVLIHEFTHTAQYERLGGIRPFLKAYLKECLVERYPNGPLEQEAIQRQRALAPVGS